MNEIILNEQFIQDIISDPTNLLNNFQNTNLMSNKFNRLEDIFNKIKTNDIQSVQEHFISDILNIISSGKEINLLKKNKHEVSKTALFKLPKKNNNIISILCVETLNHILYLIVSSENINIKNTCDLLEYADLLEILPLNAVTFYYSKAILFHNTIDVWFGGSMYPFPKSWEPYSEIPFEDVKNVYKNYYNSGVEFNGVITDISQKCYDLNKTTLINFVDYFKKH